MELSAAISHCVARRARLRSFGSSVSLRSPIWSTMAPDSKSDEAVFLEDRHLPEGLQCAIVRLVLIALPEEARPVGQAGLLQRPARAQIAHLALGEVRNPFEGGNRDHAMSSLGAGLTV